MGADSGCSWVFKLLACREAYRLPACHWLRPDTRGAASAPVASSLVSLCHAVCQAAHFYFESDSHKKPQKYPDRAGSVPGASWLHEEKMGEEARSGTPKSPPENTFALACPSYSTEQGTAICCLLGAPDLGVPVVSGVPLLPGSMTGSHVPPSCPSSEARPRDPSAGTAS